MTRARGSVAGAVVSLVALAGTALGCSYDNEDNGLSIDTLNHYYPDSYRVVLAIAEARRSGHLAKAIPEDTPKLLALQKVTRMMRNLDQSRRARPEKGPPISMLLVETMFWARFPTSAKAQLHVAGPDPTDVVAVTSEDAIARVAAGAMTMREAERLGWLQLHGEPAQVEWARARLDQFQTMMD